jgi:hypothetical protein
MTEAETISALAPEFDCLMARAGIAIPAERRESILAAYADLRGQIALLHAPRSHLAEMSNVFSLLPKLASR